MKYCFIILILFFTLIFSFNSAFSLLDNQVINLTDCGLNFIHRSVKVTYRHPSPPGSELPLSFSINEFPESCDSILAAYVWWTVSYRSSSAQTATVDLKNPFNQNFSMQAVMLGQDVDKCWTSPFGEVGTRAYRADITQSIVGNGKYEISVSTHPEETDGITLLIIYKDKKANFQGSIIINDGLITRKSGKSQQILNGFESCDESSKAYGFAVVSDVQDDKPNPLIININGEKKYFSRNFWNSEVSETRVGKHQVFSLFEVDPGEDCYSWCMFGLYYQTENCNECPTRLNVQAQISRTDVCIGDSIHLFSSGAERYEWTSVPAGFFSNEQNPIVFPSKHTTYNVKGYTDDFCYEGSDFVSVLAFGNPQIHCDDKIICRGSQVQIGANASGDASPFSYEWTPDYQLSNSKVAKPYARPDTTTRYIVKVTSGVDCVSYDTLIVTVADSLVANAGDDKETCSGKAVIIGESYSGGVPPYQYEWLPSDGLSDNHVPTPIASPKDTTRYIVKITDLIGCIDYDTVNVFASPGPIVDVGSDIMLCQGDSALLSVKIEGEAEPYVYSWNPSKWLSNNNSASTVSKPDSSITYFITVVDANGCFGYDTVNVLVSQKLRILVADTVEKCVHTQYQISTGIEGGKPPFIYQWTPAEGVSSDTSANPVINIEESQYLFVHVSDSLGCTAFDSVYVNINETPVFEIEDSIHICRGDTAFLNARKHSGDDITEVEWFPAETLNRSDSSCVEAEPEKTTIYYFSAKNSFGCEYLDSVIVLVNFPEMPVIISEKGNAICECDSTMLSPDKEYAEYLWSNGSKNREIYTKDSGEYILTTVDANGCKSTSEAFRLRIMHPKASIGFAPSSISAKSGTHTKIPIYLKSSEYLDSCNVTGFHSKILFNYSLLYPENGTDIGEIIGGHRIISFSSNIWSGAGSLLGELNFFVTQGNAEFTWLKFEALEWIGCQVETTTDSVQVVISDICRDGGEARLFFPQMIDKILSVNPNPVSGSAQVLYKLQSEKSVSFVLSNIFGTEIRVFPSSNSKAGVNGTFLDLSGIDSGIYYLTLITIDENLLEHKNTAVISIFE